MLFQVKGVWFMVAKAKPSVRKRVAAKVAKRQCLVADCEDTMVVRGLCRCHYDAAEQIINQQPTPELRAKAQDRLITDGLMLAPWTQPRPERNTRRKVFRDALGVA